MTRFRSKLLRANFVVLLLLLPIATPAVAVLGAEHFDHTLALEDGSGHDGDSINPHCDLSEHLTGMQPVSRNLVAQISGHKTTLFTFPDPGKDPPDPFIRPPQS